MTNQKRKITRGGIYSITGQCGGELFKNITFDANNDYSVIEHHTKKFDIVKSRYL